MSTATITRLIAPSALWAVVRGCKTAVKRFGMGGGNPATPAKEMEYTLCGMAFAGRRLGQAHLVRIDDGRSSEVQQSHNG